MRSKRTAKYNLANGAVFCLLAFLAGCETSGSFLFGGRGNDSGPRVVADADQVRLDDKLVAILSRQDLLLANQAQMDALNKGKTGIPIIWTNQKSGQKGQVIPGPAYSVNGRACRDFTHVVTIDQTVHQTRNIACQQTDGRWRSLDS